MLSWIRKQMEHLKEIRHRKAMERLEELKWRYQVFRSILYGNTRAVELITDLDLKLRQTNSPWPGMRKEIEDLVDVSGAMADKLNQLDDDRHRALYRIHDGLAHRIGELLDELARPAAEAPDCVPLDSILPDYAQLAGGKAVCLARMRAEEQFSVPDGFSILVGGCRRFLEETGLSARILGLLQPVLFKGEEISVEIEGRIKKEIMTASMPRDLEDAILAQAEPFFKQGKGLAVRSSALSEDGKEHSFAGQFTTVLNVTNPSALIQAVKRVIASNFSSRSLVYRMDAGMKPLDFNMSVLCLEMVDAAKAGVLFTVDPNDRSRSAMLVSAVYGMGELVVSGASTADVYHPARSGRGHLGEATIADKARCLRLDPEGGLREEEIPADMSRKPVLSEEELERLVAAGLAAERLFGSPQDVEWAFDQVGKLWLLQSRPLILEGGARVEGGAKGRKSLFEHALATSAGMATGKVHKVRNRGDLELPQGEPVILVMRRSLVDAARIMSAVQGVLVDFGNPADHLSCVAREQGRPMLVGLSNAMERLEEGQWITVDADRAAVYEATDQERKEALAQAARGHRIHGAEKGAKGNEPEDGSPMAELRRLTVRLNLTDAYGPTFSIMECKSLHDIVRYVHEKAVLAIFEAGDRLLEGTSGVVFRLETDIPFFLHIIDLGGGLAVKDRPGRSVSPEDIASSPFKALWRGIATPGLRWSAPPPVAGGVGDVMGRWLSDGRSQRPLGMPNYVIVSRDYLNLNARMDFHFTMVDAVCGLDQRANYVKFRFKGGGTAMTRRHRRALAIGEILERADFFTDVKGDLVNASFEFAPRSAIEEKLEIVGRLLGFSRLLDAAMIDDETPHLLADAFWEGDYGLEGFLEKIAGKLEGKAEEKGKAA